MSFDRRELLKGALLTAAAGVLAQTPSPSQAAENEAPSGAARRPWDVVDVNVSTFAWPFRRLPGETPAELVEKLQSLAIQQAWVGSYEGLLHRDLAGVNRRLVDACRAAPRGLLVPFGSVNPTLPDWQHDLRQCHEAHRMPGIRLHPGYHGYTLADERFARLLSQAAQRRLLVQLAVSLEDSRTQHAPLQVADVNLEPLPEILARIPAARVVLLNYKPRGSAFEPLARSPAVAFDTARVEGTDGIARLMSAVSDERVLLGSHAPFLIPEAALIKVYESQLDENQVRLLLGHNAQRLVAAA